MVSRYPFFAGAGGVVIAGVAALAGFACAGAFPAAGPDGAISALMVNRKVCTPAFLSSCFASLISIFWKYPLRFSAVMKFATEFVEADAPRGIPQAAEESKKRAPDSLASARLQ